MADRSETEIVLRMMGQVHQVVSNRWKPPPPRARAAATYEEWVKRGANMAWAEPPCPPWMPGYDNIEQQRLEDTKRLGYKTTGEMLIIYGVPWVVGDTLRALSESWKKLAIDWLYERAMQECLKQREKRFAVMYPKEQG